MDYLSNVDHYCPAVIAQEIREINYYERGDFDFDQWIRGIYDYPHNCVSSVFGYIAETLPRDAHYGLVDDYFFAVGLLKKVSPELLESIRRVALRIDVTKVSAIIFFPALIALNINIREELEGRLDKSFPPNMHEKSRAWQYAIYRGYFGDQEAWKDMAGYLRNHSYGHDVYLLLKGLFFLHKHPEVMKIMREYLDDPRDVMGANGPYSTVGKELREDLEYLGKKK